jgi:anti-sigma B factor antagonist
MMSIEQRLIEPDITVLQLQGKITAGHHSRELAIKIDELLQAGAMRVVLDLTEAAYLDSTGLGIFVMYGGKLKKDGGGLRIAGARGPVATTLGLCKIAEIIPMFATVDQAADSFGLTAGAA